jgi:hypothetical protein
VDESSIVNNTSNSAIQFPAGERFSEARVKNADVNIQECSDAKLTEAIDEAGDANERASKNEREAAQLRKDAEDERLARTKSEENIAWRRLAKAQKEEIGARLKLFHVQFSVTEYLAHDQEAGSFASDIVSALRLTDWKVPDPSGERQMYEGGSALLGSDRFSLYRAVERSFRQELADELRSKSPSGGRACGSG